MNKILKAYMSFEKLFLNINSSELKLISLWFDELIVQFINKNSIIDILEKKTEHEKMNDSTLKELKKIYVPLTKYITEFESLFKYSWECNDKLLVKTAETTAIDTMFGGPANIPDYVGMERDISKESAMLIGAIEPWMTLRSKELCTFLPSSREAKILNQMFPSEKKQTFDSFSEILNSKVPNLESYSWDEIIELRNHEYFSSFREKICLLHEEINNNESKTIIEIVDELERNDMIKIMKMFRPSPQNAIIKGMASNIPMPIPVNPFSIISSYKDVKKEIDISKKFGWLYFLIDINSK